MKKLIGYTLLVLYTAFMAVMVYLAIAWEQDPVTALFFVAFIIVIWVVVWLIAKAKDEYYADPFEEIDNRLLAFHPYYEDAVKSIKMFALDGYAVMIVAFREGKDICLIFKLLEGHEYPTLRKDNPLYDKAKRLIEEREDAE
jgi:hypothetical protein